jgi:thioredoxin-related protein
VRILFLLIPVVVALLGCGPEGPTFSVADIRVHTNAVPVNLTAEIARANKEHKLLVLQFTGSDWCYGCMLFEKQVFQNPQFQAYMKSNLVFVELDLPQRSKVPEDILKTNILLSQQFNVETFPCTIVLDKNGQEVWRNAGFVEGELEPFLRKLELRRRDVLR